MELIRMTVEQAVAEAPDTSAVFLIWPRPSSGAPPKPYLARTAHLRRLLRRLLGVRPGGSRLLNLREISDYVEYLETASRLAAQRVLYDLARRHFPESYASQLKLRPPPLLKVLLANEFPRTMVTTRLSGSSALHFGPFRSRASAEEFEQEVLGLFQVRRCQEDLLPSPGHPGCIYGEMMRCLRPCQDAVTPDEYRSESNRLVRFLQTDGASLLESIGAARDRCSEEMNFEEARKQHERYRQVEELLRRRDELACDVQHLCGVAVLPSTHHGFVELHFLRQGVWLPPALFELSPLTDKMVPLNQRLADVAASLPPTDATLKERQEHLTILARWFYSTWRDGDWLGFPSFDAIPYRKLVRAISRVGSGEKQQL